MAYREKLCGVYQIRNRTTGERYVGASTHIKCRWKSHRCSLRKPTYDGKTSRLLHEACHGSSIGLLGFEILLLCSPADLAMYEQAAVDTLMPEYNLRTEDVTTNAGMSIELTPEGRAVKVAATIKFNRARERTPEYRHKISEKIRALAKRYVVFGERLSIREMSERYGYTVHVVRKRVEAGWAPEDAVTRPVRQSVNGGRL